MFQFWHSYLQNLILSLPQMWVFLHLGAGWNRTRGSNTGVLLTERQSVLTVEIFFLMYQEVLGFDFLASATALFTHSWGGTQHRFWWK